MKLEALKKDKVQIPHWMGNDNEKADERIRVIWKSFPTAAQSGKYKPFKYDGSGNVTLVYDDDGLLRDHLDHIERLEIGVPIETADDILKSEDLRLATLISEMRTYALAEAGEITQGESEASE